jgi:hypothetical protein
MRFNLDDSHRLPPHALSHAEAIQPWGEARLLRTRGTSRQQALGHEHAMMMFW